MQVHTSVHSKETSFLCVTCGASYTRQTHLKEHNKRVHVGEKRFSCIDCGKPFFSPQVAGHIGSYRMNVDDFFGLNVLLHQERDVGTIKPRLDP